MRRFREQNMRRFRRPKMRRFRGKKRPKDAPFSGNWHAPFSRKMSHFLCGIGRGFLKKSPAKTAHLLVRKKAHLCARENGASFQRQIGPAKTAHLLYLKILESKNRSPKICKKIPKFLTSNLFFIQFNWEIPYHFFKILLLGNPLPFF